MDYTQSTLILYRFEFLRLLRVSACLRDFKQFLQPRLPHGVVDGILAELLLFLHHLRDRIVVELESQRLLDALLLFLHL